MEIVGRLASKSDAVVENNATEMLDRAGVTYDWLRQRREGIIFVRMAAYGSSGPYAQARALGVHLESVMGHTLLRGYRDLEPTTSTPIFSGDYLAGAQSALAVMMALWHRERTGKGQLIELAQAENAAAMLAEAYMDYSLNGRVMERMGNRSLHGAVPSGVFPCRGGEAREVEDRWICISVTSDEEWKALCGVMGREDWADSPMLARREGRKAQEEVLEADIAEWTKGFDDYDLFHRLQAAGVPAAPVLDGSRAIDDPHVQARGVYEAQTLLDGIGPYRYITPFYRFPETPARVRQPPVAMGEHNDYVYREVLGVDDAEYERLKAADHVSMDFDVSVR